MKRLHNSTTMHSRARRRFGSKASSFVLSSFYYERLSGTVTLLYPRARRRSFFFFCFYGLAWMNRHMVNPLVDLGFGCSRPGYCALSLLEAAACEFKAAVE